MYKKILVCLDGSDLAETILLYALEQTRRFESNLILFRVFSETPVISVAMPGMPGLPIETEGLEKRLAEEERETENYLKSLVDKIRTETGLNVNYDKMLGVAGPAIIEFSNKHEIELIAIATHGRSGLGRVVLGSVADYVIRHSATPILLIRPGKNKS